MTGSKLTQMKYKNTKIYSELSHNEKHQGSIIDMTGKDGPKQITSLAVKHGEIAPELRHNLSLLLGNIQHRIDETEREISRGGIRIESMSKHLKSLEQSQKVSRNKLLIGEGVKIILDRCLEITKVDALASLSDLILVIVTEHREAYEVFNLEAFLFSIIGKLWKTITARWDPFENPLLELATFKTWSQSWIQVNSGDGGSSRESTPYESLFSSIWLPCVRRALNDQDWRFDLDSHLAISFLEKW